jgi:hypothetical protein
MAIIPDLYGWLPVYCLLQVQSRVILEWWFFFFFLSLFFSLFFFNIKKRAVLLRLTREICSVIFFTAKQPRAAQTPF